MTREYFTGPGIIFATQKSGFKLLNLFSEYGGPRKAEKVFLFQYMNEGYIQLNRTATTAELLKTPECFALLTLIAIRARRTDDGFNPHGLQIGQALIGDFKSVGLSSEKVYRNVKSKLEKWNLAAFKGTNKGTIATLLNSEVYDINADEKGEQKGGTRADKGRTEGDPGATQGRTKGGQGATKKNDNNDKNGKNDKNEKNEKKESHRVVSLFPTNNENSEKKEEAPGAEIVLPWPSEAFRAAWNNWKTYKAGEFKFKYKTPQSEQAALNDLCNQAGGRELEAINIINHSMAKAWKGLYIPKTDNTNGKQGTNGNDQHKSRNIAPGVTVQGYATSLNERFGGEGQ